CPATGWCSGRKAGPSARLGPERPNVGATFAPSGAWPPLLTWRLAALPLVLFPQGLKPLAQGSQPVLAARRRSDPHPVRVQRLAALQRLFLRQPQPAQ